MTEIAVKGISKGLKKKKKRASFEKLFSCNIIFNGLNTNFPSQAEKKERAYISRIFAAYPIEKQVTF